MAFDVGDKPKTQEQCLREHLQRCPGGDEEKPEDDSESAHLDANIDALMKAIVALEKGVADGRSLQSDMHDITDESSHKMSLEVLCAMVHVNLQCNRARSPARRSSKSQRRTHSTLMTNTRRSCRRS